MTTGGHDGVVEIDRIAERYRALCELVPLKPMTSKSGYDTAIEHLNRLRDAGGASESHPLAGLVEALGELIRAYEKRQASEPDAEPREVLRHLMDERDLRQSDLADVATQGAISDILSGRRGISKALARKLAARFGVSAAVFL